MILLRLRWLVLAFTFVSASAPAAEPAALPGDSVYHLDAAFTDQQGREFVLAQRRGKPQLVAMFYTSCRYVCPLIIDSAKGVERTLDEGERERLGILLVSMDPARDDTAALGRVAEKRRLDPQRWTLARTGSDDVRRLAALLGVRYRALSDGEFNHTSALVLLDADGRRIASTARLGAVPDPEFVAKLKAALAR